MAERPRGSGGLRKVSDILTDVAEADELPHGQRTSIRIGQGYLPNCWCGECMRAYMASVESKGDTA